MFPLDAKKHDTRHWQIGPYNVRLPENVEDNEAEAWKAAMTAVHTGEHSYAETFKVAERRWRIDGQDVVLAQTMPDTEEQARAVLDEAQSPLG